MAELGYAYPSQASPARVGGPRPLTCTLIRELRSHRNYIDGLENRRHRPGSVVFGKRAEAYDQLFVAGVASIACAATILGISAWSLYNNRRQKDKK